MLSNTESSSCGMVGAPSGAAAAAASAAAPASPPAAGVRGVVSSALPWPASACCWLSSPKRESRNSCSDARLACTQASMSGMGRARGCSKVWGERSAAAAEHDSPVQAALAAATHRTAGNASTSPTKREPSRQHASRPLHTRTRHVAARVVRVHLNRARPPRQRLQAHAQGCERPGRSRESTAGPRQRRRRGRELRAACVWTCRCAQPPHSRLEGMGPPPAQSRPTLMKRWNTAVCRACATSSVQYRNSTCFVCIGLV